MEDEGGGGGAPEWMVTFSDLVTLLLCFFILLYAMSHIEEQKLIGLMQSMTETFNPRAIKVEAARHGPTQDDERIGQAGILDSINAMAPPVAPQGFHGGSPSPAAQRLANAAEAVRALARRHNLDQQLDAQQTSRGTVITFSEMADLVQGVTPFAPGSAELGPEFKQVLDLLSPILREASNKIEVQGHTDSRPIHSALYPSNWELSCARAGSVVRYFTARHAMPEHQFAATGLAATVPADPAETPAAWARNRRIEIVITQHPIETYDELTRADAAASATDLTQPLGPRIIVPGLPAPRPKAPAR